jgi:hypothetical protein
VHLVGFDFTALPTLKMHSQTQIKNKMCLWQKQRNGNFRALNLFTDTVRAPTATNILLFVRSNYRYVKRHTAARRKNRGYKRKPAAEKKDKKKMLLTEY